MGTPGKRTSGMTDHGYIRKLDNHPIPETTEEIRAFMCVRNELLRLPWILEYHRRIGIKRFFIVDNGSTDGSTEYLLAQNDVHCFYTSESYSKSRWGLSWTNSILNSFGAGNWCLVIDADEMFIFPFCETKKLHSFVGDLETLGFQAVLSLVVDMYSQVPIKEALYKSGEPFLGTCHYFDANTYRAFRAPAYPPIQACGGPRQRVFWSNRKVDFHPPTTSVVPLIKWQIAYEYKRGRHCINMPLNFASFFSTILHFKFFHDFYERIEKEAERGEHFAGAREYKMYLQYLRTNPDLTFYYEGSKLYEDSAQLVNLKLMNSLDNC
jgi:glycosyltransferase involved in cell wall biosynthesis